MIYSVVGHVKVFVCQEKLWTSDESSRRFMDGAAIARKNLKNKRKTCGANEVGSNMESIKYVRRATTLSYTLLRYYVTVEITTCVDTTFFTRSNPLNRHLECGRYSLRHSL